MAFPNITKEQRLEALEKAKVARKRRARILAEVKSGDMTLPEVFDMRDDETIGRIKVTNLITALPGMGTIKAERLLNELEIAPTRRLKGLGYKQIARITDWYERRVSEVKPRD